MKKVIVIGSVLLGIVFLAGCGQQSMSQSQTNQPSNIISVPADWKTYQDQKYGYQFQYPEDWKLQEYKLNGKDDVAAVGLDPNKVISKSEFDTLDTPAGLITILINEGPIDMMVGADVFPEEVIGNNIKAKKYEQNTGDAESNPAYDNKHIIEYYISNNTDNYLRIMYVSDPSDEYLSDFKQILSAFKFTE